VPDIPALLATETAALVAALEALGPDDDRWRTPSLCAGWTVCSGLRLAGAEI